MTVADLVSLEVSKYRVAGVTDTGMIGSLGPVSLANPRSEGYVQRKDGASCAGSEYFRA